MISTVTVTTVATITSVNLASALGLVAIIALFALVVQKVVISVSDLPSLKTLDRYLNVSVLPLALVFSAILIAEILKVVG